MATKLDLSALKNKAQQATTQASRSISLWSTVKAKTSVTNIPASQNTGHLVTTEVSEIQKQEVAAVKCECPIPDVAITNITKSKPIVSSDAVQKWSEEYLAAIQKKEAVNPSTPPVQAEEDEWKKAMISLSSIKSSHTEKKAIAEAQKGKETPTQEQKTTESIITVVAPAMKITDTLTTKKSSETTNEVIEDLSFDTSEVIPEETLTNEKIVNEESKKLTKQIQQDLAENKEKNGKKDIQVDDDIFDNYKPKYWTEENLKAPKNSWKTMRFKGHLSIKKRNFILAGLLLFVLGLSAGWYMYFNNTESEPIHATAIENNIVKTKENVENIINEEDVIETEETNDNLEVDQTEWETDTIIEWDIENSEEDTESENIESEEWGNDADEISEWEDLEDEVLENENWELAQAENPEESKVKNYLLDNYYK